MLAAAAMACGARPCCLQKDAASCSSRSAGVPRRHPMPSTPIFGTRCSASPCGKRVSAKSASSCAPAMRMPAGIEPEMGNSDQQAADRPASSFPLTSLIFATSRTVHCCFFAHSSTANRPLTSVAVVMTGTAPQAAASSRARSLAPPRCPDRIGTAKRPHSSTTTTAGSVALLRQWGAMARTAIPAAPTKISASLCANCCAVHAAKGTPCFPQRLTDPGRASASRPARATPRSVNAR